MPERQFSEVHSPGAESAENELYTAVLNNVLDVHTGEKVGQQIVDKVLNSESIKRVVVIGEPGVGKTVILSQIAYEIVRKSNRTIATYPTSYDDFLELREQELSLSQGKMDRDSWTQEDWEKFSHDFYKHIKDSFRQIPGYKRTIQLVEAPGIGGKVPDFTIKDRAKTAVKELAKEVSVQPDGSFDTFFLYVNGSPEAQKKSGRIRAKVAKVSDESVLRILRNENVVVEGYEDTAASGRKIKNMVRKQAGGQYIDKISREMIYESADWLMKDDINHNRVNSIILPEDVKLSEDWPEKVHEMRQTVRTKIAYSFYYLHEVLGLSDCNAKAVYNQFLEDTPIYWFPVEYK